MLNLLIKGSIGNDIESETAFAVVLVDSGIADDASGYSPTLVPSG